VQSWLSGKQWCYHFVIGTPLSTLLVFRRGVGAWNRRATDRILEPAQPLTAFWQIVNKRASNSTGNTLGDLQWALYPFCVL